MGWLDKLLRYIRNITIINLLPIDPISPISFDPYYLALTIKLCWCQFG